MFKIMDTQMQGLKILEPKIFEGTREIHKLREHENIFYKIHILLTKNVLS